MARVARPARSSRLPPFHGEAVSERANVPLETKDACDSIDSAAVPRLSGGPRATMVLSPSPRREFEKIRGADIAAATRLSPFGRQDPRENAAVE
jgi:hypothetical protein